MISLPTLNMPWAKDAKGDGRFRIFTAPSIRCVILNLLIISKHVPKIEVDNHSHQL
jgi:hypothetical protein